MIGYKIGAVTKAYMAAANYLTPGLQHIFIQFQLAAEFGLLQLDSLSIIMHGLLIWRKSRHQIQPFFLHDGGGFLVHQ